MRRPGYPRGILLGRTRNFDLATALRAAAVAALAGVATALAAGCSDGGDASVASTAPTAVMAVAPECDDTAQRPAGITLCASANTVRAGEQFEAWVVGDTQTSRGLDVALEVRRGRTWRTAATLVAPLPHGDGEPSHSLGETPVAVLKIGIWSSTRLRYVMPPVASGRYRLTQSVAVEGADGPRRTVAHRELAVP